MRPALSRHGSWQRRTLQRRLLMPEPVVTVWRNKIPHRCALTYWGPPLGFPDRHPIPAVDSPAPHAYVDHAYGGA